MVTLNVSLLFSTSLVSIALDFLGPDEQVVLKGIPYEGKAIIVQNLHVDPPCATLYFGRTLEDPVAKFDILHRRNLPFTDIDLVGSLKGFL